MLEFLRQQLAKLLEERAALKSAVDDVLKAPETEKRDLNEQEAAAFGERRDAVNAHDEKIEATRARITEIEEQERRADAAALMAVTLGQTGEHRTPSTVTGELATYRQHGAQSWFRDLVHAQLFASYEARERLIRNDREVRALNTTDGTVGEFVPPLWMVQEFIRLARAGRVIADQVRQMALPAGTDTINLPRLATGTAVAEQATQNTAVQATDATSNSISASVATIAGQQVLSLQLIEQSPINIDEIILADLAADYATKIDVFVINNNAAGKIGLLNVVGANAITYTSASPTVAGLYPKIADAIQQVSTGRFLPPQKIFMHPRRWAWFTAALDSQSRPLVLPAAGSPMNTLATQGGVVPAEGAVGVLQGLPVFLDPNLPINLGAGTNEDRVIVARTDEIILMEGTPRAEAFRETKADQLSVLLRFYNYAAVQAGRYPKAISVISGTGLVTPTF